MKLIELPIRAKVELNVTENNEIKTYKTLADDVIDGELFVLYPLDINGESAIKKDDEIKLLYGANNSLLMWHCKVGKTIKSNNVLLLEVIPFNENGESYNRRNGYRVAFVTNIDYVVRKEDDKVGKVSGKMKDISISGIAFYSPHKHDIGEILAISFDVKNKLEIANVRIVRECPPENGFYFYGAQFLQPPTKDVEKLINEIQMMELRNRKNRR